MSKRHLQCLDEYLYQVRLSPDKRKATFESANISNDTKSYYGSLINARGEKYLAKRIRKQQIKNNEYNSNSTEA